MKFVALMLLAGNNLQEPARGNNRLGFAFSWIDQGQFQTAKAHLVLGAQLIARPYPLAIDERAGGGTAVGEVVKAVVLADLSVERADIGVAQYQVVAAVLANGETFVNQPDRRLTVVAEVNPEHVRHDLEK